MLGPGVWNALLPFDWFPFVSTSFVFRIAGRARRI
jgi:hypothetical protein